jgi:hypothetical protein
MYTQVGLILQKQDTSVILILTESMFSYDTL